MSSRNPFVFSLQQNFAPQLVAGKLLYDKNPEGIIERLTPLFFIGIGQSELITGPYQILGNIVFDPFQNPVAMARMKETDMAHGVWNELRVSCPYYVKFKSLVPIEQGFTWDNKFCKKYGLQTSGWENLVHVSMTIDQIDDLADKLRKLNTPVPS